MGKKTETIFVVGAHPDDQIFGAGGTISHYSRKGAEVITLILSYGESSHPWLKEHVTASMRANEAKEADKVVGSDLTLFFGLEETKFRESAEKKKFKEKLKRLFEKKHPTKIFIHSFEDPHPDHRACHEMVLEVLDTVDVKPRVYLYAIWDPFDVRKNELPQVFVDITKDFGRKLRSLKEFKSQKVAMFTLLWSVYVRAFKNGFKVKGWFAERFYRLR